ncbi:hypothetical protein GGH95_000465 [Coemansia sp. RSA 1836]|nr:hypothetical protein GGH95_000465 [Coemansia sp. RSA 1836]
MQPVAYFSKVFDRQQDHRHSTWREAKAVVEAVQYFYPFLDGCAKLELENDASAVIGLFSHKTRDDADDLSRFRAALTHLGISKDMLVRRPGVQHYVYSHLEASDLPEPRVHIYADVMEPGLCDDEARYGLVVRDACSGWASDDSAYQARAPADTAMLFRGTIRPIYAGEAYIGSEESIEVVSEEGTGVVKVFPELFSSSESSYQGDAPGDAQGSPTWPDRLLAEQLDDEEAGEVRYYGGGGSPTGLGTPLMYQEREKPSDEPQPAADSPTLSDRPLIEQVRVVEPTPMSDAASEPLSEARSEQSLNEQMAELLDTIR